MSNNFAEAWLPNGIQTLDGTALVGVVVNVPYDGSAETVADLTGTEVADDRIDCVGSVLLEETGWGFYVTGPTSVTLTGPSLGVWLALDGATDADRVLVHYTEAVQASGEFDPSWDSGVDFLPFESRAYVLEILAGDNVTVDSTDPQRPIVNATASGSGVPDGGDTGQVLGKLSDDDGDADWIDPPAAGFVDSDHVNVLDEEGGTVVATLTEADLPGLIGTVTGHTNQFKALGWRQPVRAVITTDLFALTAPSGSVTADGVTTAAAERYLIAIPVGDPGENQNGLWTAGVGLWTRDTDDAPVGSVVSAGPEGTTYGNTLWRLVEGGSVRTWTQITGSAGTGDVVGPGSVTADRIAVFDGTTGKLVKQASVGVAGLEVAGAAATAQAAAIAASQPVDSDLTAIAALTTTSYGRSFLALADAAAGRTLLGLGTAATSASTAFDASGSAAAAQAASQPLDSDLTSIAALTTTTFGRALLTMADAAAARTTIDASRATWNPPPTVKASDQSYASSVVLRDDTALTFAYGAGEVWTGEALLYAYGATGADLAVGIAASTSATLFRAGVVGPANTYAGSAASIQTQGNLTALTTVGGAGFGIWGTGTTAAAGAFVTIRFTFSSASAGTLSVQHCQAVTSVTNLVIEAGSTLTMRRSS